MDTKTLTQRTLIGGLLILLAVFFLATARVALGKEPAPARHSASAGRDYNFNASGELRSLTLHNVAGDVNITPGKSFSAKVHVRITAATQAKAKEILEKTQVGFSNHSGEICLVTLPPGSRVRKGEKSCPESWRVAPGLGSYKLEASYEIVAPPAIAASVNVVNGSVTTRGLRGTQELSSVNGSVTVREGGGNAELSAVNGKIDADFIRLARDASVEAQTVNGEIRLSLPRDAGFDFSGSTFNGDIVSTFPLPVRKVAQAGSEPRQRVRAERSREERRSRERVPEPPDPPDPPDTPEPDEDDDVDWKRRTEEMEELGEEMERIAEEISASVVRDLHGQYEGAVGGGGANIEATTLNGRIAVLAAGTTMAQAKPVLARRSGRGGPYPRVAIAGVPRPPAAPHPAPRPAPAPRPRTVAAPAPAPHAPRAPRPPRVVHPERGERGGREGIVSGDVSGDFVSDVPLGNIRLGRVAGRVDVSTQSGDIHVTHAGKSAELETHGGDIGVESVAGDLRCKTLGGDIHVGRVSGAARLETMGGDIHLESCAGALVAKTGGGEIMVRAAGGSVTVATGGGGVECVVVAREQEGGVSIATGGGDITLTLPANYRGTVEIEVEDVDDDSAYIVSDFPEIAISREGEVQRGRGKLNGGGPRVVLHASSGTVVLRKGPAAVN